VDNSPEQIVEAVRRASQERDRLRAGAARLKARKHQAFAETLAGLRARLAGTEARRR
jgi:hypothetical protein